MTWQLLPYIAMLFVTAALTLGIATAGSSAAPAGAPAEPPTLEAQLILAAASPGAERAEQPARFVDIRTVPVAEASRFAGWPVILRDVTRQRRDRALLKELLRDLELKVTASTAELREVIILPRAEVAEQERVERSLRQMESSLADHSADQRQKLAALSDMIVLASQSLDTSELRACSLERILVVFEADAGCVHLTPPEGETRLAFQIGLAPDVAEDLAVLPVGASLDRPGFRPLAGFRTAFATPIHLQGHETGMLTDFWRASRWLSADDETLQ